MIFSALFVGNEILEGLIEDKNFAFLSRFLSKLGYRIKRAVFVEDEKTEIKDWTERLLKESDILIICGGLGPTRDDVTKEAVSEALGLKLQFSERLWNEILKKLKERGKSPKKSHEKMAFLPEGSDFISNPIGLAPAIIIKTEKKTLTLFPGVPHEFKELLLQVIPKLVEKKEETLKVFKTFGLRESEVNEKVKDILEGKNWGTIIKHGEIWITVRTTPLEAKRLKQSISEIFGPDLFGEDEQTLEGIVGRLLKEKKLTVSSAESCTAGLVASFITAVSGSSDYFKGGVVSYWEEAKEKILGVKRQTIEKHTVYSHEVAREMAEGARKLFSTDFAVATTGIAGPTGALPGKPVGTVYVGLSSENGTESFEFHFPYDREGNKIAFAKAALDVLRRALQK